MVEYFIYKHFDHYKPIPGVPGYVNVGFRWGITDNFMIMGSFGRQVVVPNGTAREEFISWFGVKNLF